MDKQIDILAIGDIVSEPFIKINDIKGKWDEHGGHCMLCLNFGDKIPYESAEVLHALGNSSNVSVGASKLGLNSYLVSYVGDDQNGKEDIKALMENNVHTDYISIVNGLPSNYHYVLWYGDERTILVKHTEFPYSFDLNLPEPKWIYLSSLASNSEEYHSQILEYLKQHPKVKLAFQPGTFQIKLGLENLKEIYQNTEVLFCNKEEAQKILATEEEDFNKLMNMLKLLGPKIVVVTDGLNGAYELDEIESWYVPAYPGDAFESTGAGDAFSSAFITALINEKAVPEALIWGTINAMSVVSQLGPQKGVLTKEQLEEYLLNIPEQFKAKKIK